jgi:hypothetical protein
MKPKKRRLVPVSAPPAALRKEGVGALEDVHVPRGEPAQDHEGHE